MTDHSSSSIRAPKNWQDFERSSSILFECILDDIQVQNNGRTGQPQHGVDIYGRKNGVGSKWFGIQCKGKDAGYGGKATEKELREEVEKSRKFTPPISDFILVTTAPVDESIQTIARTITKEREDEGDALSVSVWGWGELEKRISQYPKALQAFEPDASPYSKEILSNTAHVRLKIDEQSEKMEMLIQEVRSSHQPLNIVNDTSAVELLDKTLHAQIDGYRDLLKEGKPRTALQLLETLKSQIWDSASDRIKFRLITNVGSSKLRLLKEKEAADHFLEAIQYQPEDKIALANVALAYLLKKEHANVITASRVALGRDACNAEAASYLILAYIDDDAIDDPLVLVPNTVKDTPSVYIATIDFYRKRKDLRWVASAKIAVHRYPEDEQLVLFAAEAELEIALSTRELLSGQKPVNSLDLGALRNASEVLQKSWDKQCNSELSDLDTSLPFNLTQLYRIIDEVELAKTVTLQAIEKIPNAPEIIKLCASFYLKEHRTEDAVALLEKASDDPDAILMLAEVRASKDPVAALETLERIEQVTVLEAHHSISVGWLRIESWLTHPELSNEDRLKEANKVYDVLRKEYKKSPLVALIHSQILEAADEVVELIKAVENAKYLLKDDSPFYERYMVARRFEVLESYSDAVDVLDGYVDYSHDSPPLHTLFLSLIYSDRRVQAYELLSAIPKDVAEQSTYLVAAINLHFRRGDHAAAESVINKYLKLQPNSLHTHLNRVDIWLRHRNDKAVRQFLTTHVENLEGTPEDFMRLAHLLNRFALQERALKLGYKIHIENPRNPQIQLAYIGILLKPSSSGKIELEKTVVGMNVAFTIKNSSGEEATFIIEENEALRLIDEAIAPTHLFASAANGLKKGNTFQVHDGEEWEIVSVKHKYLYLLHTKMDSFSRHFPENRGLQRFSIKEEGEKSLEPILQKIKEKHDANELILDKYEELPLPLEMFAEWLGADVIEAWYGLSQAGRKFKVCHGSNPERASAIKAIEKNNQVGCVLDALTLHIVRSIGIEEVVTEICGPLAVTESTIDTFRYRREQVLSYGEQPFMTMYWKNGQFYRDEMTKEQLQQILARHEQVLDWIDRQIEIIPAESNEIVSEEAGRIRDALSYDFLDPILAAQGSKKMLVCEDQSYRQFGATVFNLKATWLQPVLILALERKILSMERYGKIICTLVGAGHSFTSIDSTILNYALESGKEDIQIVTQALFGADAEMRSHQRVMIAFLQNIWKNDVEPSLREQSATSIMLRRLFFGGWKNNAEDTSIKSILTLLAPLRSNRFFISYLTNWLKGHFLLPP